MTRSRLLRALLTATSLVLLAPGLLTLAGGFLPDVSAISRLGALLNEGLIWVWLSVLAATVLSSLAVLLGGRRATPILLAASIIGVVGAAVVTVRYASFAADHGASFSLLRQAGAPGATRQPTAVVTYATVDNQALHAGVWRASEAGTAAVRGAHGRAAIVYVHGGAFVGGELGMRPQQFASLADAGYPVIDVEYRLSPPPRWDQAPADILCALAWLPSVAAEYDIDPARVVVMGESAGGSLALLAAYAAGTDQLAASCPGEPIVPAGVIAVAPAADLAGIWQDATLVAADRRFPEVYVGGSPSDVPDRYDYASPFRLIRAGLPPTLLLAGENDHLVRLPRITTIADRLVAAGVDCRLLILPYADHGFDGPPNGFGAQLEDGIVPAFVAGIRS